MSMEGCRGRPAIECKIAGQMLSELSVLLELCRKMVEIANSQGSHGRFGQNMALISISFQFAEILSRLLYTQPEALAGLSQKATGGQQGFLDWLLTLLSTR